MGKFSLINNLQGTTDAGRKGLRYPSYFAYWLSCLMDIQVRPEESGRAHKGLGGQASDL